MPVINESASNLLIFISKVVGETLTELDAYGTLSEANTYFSNQLRSEEWVEASEEDKRKALVEATRIIDSLKYKGDKSDSAQIHAFPRDNVATPKEIHYACFEIAKKLIEGVDPDMERDNLAASMNTYGGVRTTYDRSFVLDHLLAGIPSFKAWAFLRPHLKDPATITISRVN